MQSMPIAKVPSLDHQGGLTPTGSILVQTTAGPVDIPLASPTFRPWTKEPPGDAYGGKQFLDYRGGPGFAELVILWTLRDAGWDGIWVDSFRRTYWTGYEERLGGDLPSAPAQVIRRIHGSKGFPRGCWDVLCWRRDQVLFAEAKRHRQDRIRPTQVQWLTRGIAAGLAPTDFLIVEWSVAGGARGAR